MEISLASLRSVAVGRHISRKIPTTIAQRRALSIACHLFATILRHDERQERKETKAMSDTTTTEQAVRPSPRIVDVIAYMALTFGIGIAVSMVLAGAVLFLNSPV
jgi:predicted phage tail protein